MTEELKEEILSFDIKEIMEADPSKPVEITGLQGNPSAGDKFMAFETESEAKNVAEKMFNDVVSSLKTRQEEWNKTK